MATSTETFEFNAYRVELNKEKLTKDLDDVEMNNLVDHLISKGILYREFEKPGEKFKKKVIDIILRKIKEDDRGEKTKTYVVLQEFLQKNDRTKHISVYLEKSPGIDPVIANCFTAAKKISLDGDLLQKILVTISGNWKGVLEALDIKDQDYDKNLAFKMWFNSKGYKDGELLTLLKALYHSKDCSVDWKLMESHLIKHLR
ncbi:uncharacterized protein LOC115219510 [Octopus sinensis]|uniref:Uncharacterized protein LOC115219510 n=1 Tax=Octopus sinensis TaxID=2607531 RepID=A0A6P7T567_9MOLL|nr:uncharacterized protein LOC115219510 [Octopus sinensis]